MNFTRLLAAGRSVMGIKRAPGPYRMNEDHLLPRFELGQRCSAAVPPANLVAAQGETEAVGAAALAPVATRLLPENGGGARPGLLRRLWRRLIPGQPKPSSSKARRNGGSLRAVQTELSLDGIRVVRNDLSDGEGEIVTGDRAAGQGKAAGASPRRQPGGMVWNQLSARLLRQAVQEFNVIQKQRGKLLSQAGHDGGGSGRP